MKFLNFSKYLLAVLLIVSCNSNSEEDCIKIIIVQPELTVSSPTGTTFIPQITQEVPCNFPEPEVAKVITGFPKLSEFSYEILDLIVIPDTGNNTSKISYSVKLNNLSNTTVKGLPYLTTRINNDSMTASYAFTDGCSEIKANSSCIINFEGEDSLDLIQINSFRIENVEYIIIQ